MADDQQAYSGTGQTAAFPDNQGGQAFGGGGGDQQMAQNDAINPHFIQPGSIPSFAGPHPDTRGDANYGRPERKAPAGFGSFTGKVG